MWLDLIAFSVTIAKQKQVQFVFLISIILMLTAWKCPNAEFFLLRLVSYLDSVFSPNTGKNGSEKTPYLNTFNAVSITQKHWLLTHATVLFICPLKASCFQGVTKETSDMNRLTINPDFLDNLSVIFSYISKLLI